MDRDTHARKASTWMVAMLIVFGGFGFVISTAPQAARGDPPFSGNVLVNTDFMPAATQNDASIAVDASGKLYLAWEDTRNTEYDIYFANSTDGGATWSFDNKMVNTDASGQSQENPSIAVDGSGTVHAVWQDYRDPVNYGWDIYYANSTDGGAIWTDPNVRVNSDDSPETQSRPAIAVNSTGGIYVVWQDRRSGTDYDICFAKSTDGGATWTYPNMRVSIDATNASQRDPVIAVDSLDNIYVAWRDNRNVDWDIYFAMSSDGGATWSNPNVRINSDSTGEAQQNPTIAVNATGTVYLAWEDERNASFNGSDIYFAQSADGGANWGPNVRVNTDTGNFDQLDPAIAVDQYDNIYLAWEDFRSSTDFDIYFADSQNGGVSWTHPNQRVNDDTGTYHQYNPTVAVDATSKSYVAWEDFRNTQDYDIYSASRGPPPKIDRVIISLTDDASSGWFGDKTYFMSDSDTLYACGWNETLGVFVSLVEVDWECNDTMVGSVAPSPGQSTTFTPVGPGVCKVTATNASYPINSTGVLTVFDLEIDSIIISHSSDFSSGWIGDQTYTKHEEDIFYACGWNDTAKAFVALVSVNWQSNDTDVGDVSTPGTQTTFTAQDVGICNVTATHASYGTNRTGVLTVTPLDIDGVLISRSMDGTSGWIGDHTYKKHEIDTLYACGWNQSRNEFVALVDATWSSDNNSVGTVDPGTISSTSFNAVGLGVCNVTATNVSHGSNDTGLLTVIPPDIDRIMISETEDGSSDWVGDKVYTKHDNDTYYACGWNATHWEFVSLVDVTWESDNPSVGNVSPTGTSTTFNATGAGLCKVTATSVSYGGNETGVLTVNPLGIDKILVSRSSDGSSDWIGDRTYGLDDTDTFYACGWNDTYDEFVGLVDATWASNNTDVGNVSSPGNFTTFTAEGAGVCRVTASNGTFGSNDTGIITVNPMGIDSLVICLASDGTGGWVGDRYYGIGDSEDFFACGWNKTFQAFVTLVEVDWQSNDFGVGTVAPAAGFHTTFTAEGVGTCNVSATSATYGVNWTGVLTVSDFGIDKIIISLAPDASSGWIGDQTYTKYENATFYAWGWNETQSLFVKLVPAVWESSDESCGKVAAAGVSTTFNATGKGTCIVTATNSTYGDNSTGILTVNPLGIDTLIISPDADGAGGWVGHRQYIGGEDDIFYACGWNKTHKEFVSLVDAQWESNDDTVGTVTTPGLYTNFTAQSVTVDGVCEVTASYPVLGLTNSTGVLTVLAPKIDYIKIMDAPGGLGSTVTAGVYSVSETDDFHAAAFNESGGYMYDVEVTWSSDNESVGLVDSPGLWTNFSAQQVPRDAPCTITATYSGDIHNTTGLLTVLAPRVDYVQVRNASGGLGNIVTTAAYDAQETDMFYAAAFNDTVDYLYDVEVAWESDDTAVGEVTSPGIWTNFTAKTVAADSTCTVTAKYSTDIHNSTGALSIRAGVDITPPSQPGQPTPVVAGKNTIVISWPANTDPDLKGYRIYRRTSPTENWSMIKEVDADTTTYTDDDLEAGTTYYYTITAFDTASPPNESPQSPVVSATTEKPKEEFPLMLLLIIIIVVVIVVVLLLLMLGRKKPAETAAPPEYEEPYGIPETQEETAPPTPEEEQPAEGSEEEEIPEEESPYETENETEGYS